MPEAFQWIGYAAVTLLSLFGAGKIAELTIVRHWKKKDDDNAIHQTNQAKQIDADVTALKLVTDRLEKVENRLDEMQKENNSLSSENARLSAENGHLAETNKRLEGELKEVRADNRTQRDRVQALENKVNDLTRQYELLLQEKTGAS